MGYRHWLLLTGVALSGASSAGCLAQPGPEVTVLSVGDGDTIRVRQGGEQITVRLACIDAPELAQRPDGPRARDSLRARLPPGTALTLEVKATDRYGRTVAEVFRKGNVGLAMVEAGQAFAYRRYLDRCDASAYLEAEAGAGLRRSGIWRKPDGITRPWAFRRSSSMPMTPE
ncbi:MAG: thermonuclease family protein [Prochlorococcaceae cyanobacterium]